MNATKQGDNQPGPRHEDFLEMLRTADKPVMVTQGKRIVFVNALLESLLEIPEQQLYDMNAADCYHPDEVSVVVNRLREFLAGKMIFPAYRTRMMTGNGDVRHVEVISTPCFWLREPAFLSFLTDLSNENRLEQELRAMQRLQSIGTLAGGIAHDFNNILSIIQGSVSMVMDETSPLDPRYKDLRAIESQVENGAWLTQQILGYARHHSHKVEAIDIVPLIGDALDTFARTRKHIGVHHPDDISPHWISADVRAIKHALLNLCINAADAMPDGGDLDVSIDTVDGESILQCQDQATYVRISVKDSGTGIDESYIDRIFEPFFTTKQPGRGTGLGLSSVYGIVKSHDGYVEVNSSASGTVFDLFIPLAAAPDRDGVVGPGGSKTSGRERLLVVDDEVLLLRLAERNLKKLGYDVLTASSGSEALELYREQWGQIDLVILDIIMPGMGGEEIYAHMKDINADVRVVFASGYAKEEQAQKLKELGHSAFLPKPYTRDGLSRSIREVLDEHGYRQLSPSGSQPGLSLVT